MTVKRVIVIGGGPAGLTAALELLRQTEIDVTVLEADQQLGGIAKTVTHHGNRIDMGGHRFFSKSDWVMNWWQDILPIQAESMDSLDITYRGKKRKVAATRPARNDEEVMLVRNRLSRIYLDGKFISYPVKANLETALQLGLLRVARIILSYGRAWAFPRRPENSLEDFLINRFGRELYQTFFRGYTEKVWGVPCSAISADWGAQRIKGLSIFGAIWHFLKQLRPTPKADLASVGTKTSLIEYFLYPKYGPGQMWETVGKRVRSAGGEIHLNRKAVELEVADGSVKSVTVEDTGTGKRTKLPADYVISTMPVVELIDAMGAIVPGEVGAVARDLQYRDFVIVGLLYKKLRPTSGAIAGSPLNLVPDNWIYIQDDGIQAGRVQIYNNWSPFMVSDKDTVWVGLEYFCKEGDDFWTLEDRSAEALASHEMEILGLADRHDLLDAVVLRVPKAYPGYYGGYENFSVIRAFTDSIDNLFLVGRNGMHKYNNQDHSMLTAHYAAEAIISGSPDKRKIWDVNIDDEYHEE